MRVSLVLIATFVAIGSAANINLKNDHPLSVSSIVKEAVEDFRKQMPCGIPDLGVPIMAPLKIDRKEINFISEILSASVESEGEVTDLQIDDLDEFDIEQLKVNVMTSRVSFLWRWKQIPCKAKYQFKGSVEKGIISADLVGDGNATVVIKGLELQGNIKYHLDLASRRLKLKEFKMKFTVEDIESNIDGIFGNGFLNKKVNEFLSEWCQLVVNENPNLITIPLESYVLPKVNKKLENVTLAEIAEAIGNSENSPVCNKPVEENQEKIEEADDW